MSGNLEPTREQIKNRVDFYIQLYTRFGGIPNSIPPGFLEYIAKDYEFERNSVKKLQEYIDKIYERIERVIVDFRKLSQRI